MMAYYESLYLITGLSTNKMYQHKVMHSVIFSHSSVFASWCNRKS